MRVTQEAKYVERWPNTTSAWAGWSRFDIPVDRYGGVHPLLICTSCILGTPTCHRASQQENTYSTKYQKADRASTLVTLWGWHATFSFNSCTYRTQEDGRWDETQRFQFASPVTHIHHRWTQLFLTRDLLQMGGSGDELVSCCLCIMEDSKGINLRP